MNKIDGIIAKRYGDVALSLHAHSIDIAERCLELAKGLTEDKNIQWYCYVSGLFHDVGKSSELFQQHINGQNKNSNYPLHNLLGSCLVDTFVRMDMPEKDDYIKKVIAKAITYHHPLDITEEKMTEQQIMIDDIIDDDYFQEVLADLIDINNKKFPEFKLKLIERYYNGNDGNVDYDAVTEYYSSEETFSKSLQDLFNIVVNILRDADATFGIEKDKRDKMFNRKNVISIDEIKKPDGYDERFDEQVKHVKELINYNESVFKSQTGFGKTMLGILYALYANNRKTYWICPMNTIAEGVYKTLVKEVNNLGFSERLSISLLLTGEYVYGDKDADIIVTNIDNFLKPLINNETIERSYSLLYANCIFDEFHEYLMEAPIMALFEIMAKSRHLLNSRTLYLSATPILNFFGYTYDFTIKTDDEDEKYRIKQENGMNEKFGEKEFYINFASTIDQYCGDDKIEDGTLISVTSTGKAQEVLKDKYVDLTFHSRFLPTDKKNIFDKVSNEFGKNGNRKLTVSATNIVTTGLDISFKNIIINAPLPDRMIQTIGRCNRWGENEKSVITLIPLENDGRSSEKGALKNQKYCPIYYDGFYNLLYEKFKNRETIKLNELYSIRKEFYNNKENKNTIKQRYKKFKTETYKNLAELNYQMSFVNANNETKGKFIGNNKLRQTSDIKYNSFYCILPDVNGNYIDEVFVGNGVIFDFNKYKPSIRQYTNMIKKNFKKNPKYFSGNDEGIERLINTLSDKGDLINYMMKKAKNKETPLPIPYEIWYYDKELGIVLKKN